MKAASFIESQAEEMRQNAARFLQEIMNGSTSRRNYKESTKTRIQAAWGEALPDYFEHL